MPRRSLYDARTAIDVAQVLGARLPLLAMEAMQPTAKGAKEMARMVSEKQTAFALGMIGAQQAWMTAWLGGGTNCARTTAEVMAAAEAPALKTLRGNARRLSRRKGRG